jgi:hypothetical protein
VQLLQAERDRAVGCQGEGTSIRVHFCKDYPVTEDAVLNGEWQGGYGFEHGKIQQATLDRQVIIRKDLVEEIPTNAIQGFSLVAFRQFSVGYREGTGYKHDSQSHNDHDNERIEESSHSLGRPVPSRFMPFR